MLEYKFHVKLIVFIVLIVFYWLLERFQKCFCYLTLYVFFVNFL